LPGYRGAELGHAHELLGHGSCETVSHPQVGRVYVNGVYNAGVNHDHVSRGSQRQPGQCDRLVSTLQY
jgi:hypothetical protein